MFRGPLVLHKRTVPSTERCARHYLIATGLRATNHQHPPQILGMQMAAVLFGVLYVAMAAVGYIVEISFGLAERSA
jgi:hypothetical protein